MSRKSYILFLVGFYILSFVSCGLPETRSLPRPEKIDTGRLRLSSSVLAFKTPSDITFVQGYALYYKVYYSQSDFIAEEDDSKWFDEGYYINNNSEMQPGEVICNERGFIRVGEFNADTSSYPAYLITNPPSPSTIVYIDFDSAQNRSVMGDDSLNPIVGFEYPISTVQKTLARGVIDPTANSNSFRSFIADWDFDVKETPGDGFYDADLCRKHNKPQSITTPESVTNFYKTGKPFWDIAVQDPTQLIIGFVVYSFGLDPLNFQFLYSKPVFIGTVGYSPIRDTTTRTDVTRP